MNEIKAIYHDVHNIIEFLYNAELAIGPLPTFNGSVVTWPKPSSGVKFLDDRRHDGLSTYLSWIDSVNYSAMLLDGSLLQITYEGSAKSVTLHRLAFVPCPYMLIDSVAHTPVRDLVEDQVTSAPTSFGMKSVVRFDFDADNDSDRHPASHLTINHSSCRVACVAPMHVGKFVDFVFRSFYSDLWSVHSDYFEGVATKTLGSRTISEDQQKRVHLAWH